MDSKIKIVCMGDSLTEGYQIDLSQRWSDLLQLDLDIEIINSGISGDTTAGMLSRFQQMVISHTPTHVIILGGTNDLWFNIPSEIIISNILAMTKLARHHGIASIIGLPTLFYPGHSQSFSDIFLDAQAFLDRLISFRSKLEEVAASKDLPTIDFSEGMTSDMYLDDGVHPNEGGHKMMFENVKNGLNEVL